MLTLITAPPRTAKTAYTVWEICRPVPGTMLQLAKGGEVPRVLYSNIRDLLVEHQHIDAEDMDRWHEWAKPGAVIVFDEVQEIWRPRGLGAKVPECIAKLETHGHMGVDIILITQDPGLVDSNVRRLVNRHIHLRRVAGRIVYRYEWDSCQLNVKSTRTCVHSGTWRRPKAVESLYTSSVAHTKPLSRLPWMVYLIPPALAGFVWFSYPLFSRLAGKSQPVQAAAASPSLILDAVDHSVSDGAVTAGQGGSNSDQVANGGSYAELVSPVTYPDVPVVVAGCMLVKTECVCFTQGGTPVDRSMQQCLASAAPRKVVLGYKEPVRDPDAGVDVTARPSPPIDGLPDRQASADGETLAWMRSRL
jgi:zona occludens toxin